MCKAWEDQKLEGIMQGRKEGIEEGIEKGIEKGKKEGRKEGKKEERSDIIHRIMANRNMSLEEVLELIGMTEEERIVCREEMAVG